MTIVLLAWSGFAVASEPESADVLDAPLDEPPVHVSASERVGAWDLPVHYGPRATALPRATFDTTQDLPGARPAATGRGRILAIRIAGGVLIVPAGWALTALIASGLAEATNAY